MATMSLHYWAGARAAAGVAEEQFEADTIAAALEAACQSRGDAFRRVVSACSLLVDGITAHPADLERPRNSAVRVELLPPFAGGSGAGRTPGKGDQNVDRRITIWYTILGWGWLRSNLRR